MLIPHSNANHQSITISDQSHHIDIVFLKPLIHQEPGRGVSIKRCLPRPRPECLMLLVSGLGLSAAEMAKPGGSNLPRFGRKMSEQFSPVRWLSGSCLPVILQFTCHHINPSASNITALRPQPPSHQDQDEPQQLQKIQVQSSGDRSQTGRSCGQIQESPWESSGGAPRQ